MNKYKKSSSKQFHDFGSSKFSKENSKITAEKQLKETDRKSLERLKLLYARGEFSDVLNLATEILKTNPNDFEVWNILGASLVRLGKL